MKNFVAGVAAVLSLGLLLDLPDTRAQSIQASRPASTNTTTQSRGIVAPVAIGKHVDLVSKQAELAAAHPGVRIGSWEGSTSIYGKAFGQGANPIAAAENFRTTQLPALLAGTGVSAADLKPYANFLPPDENTVPLMYQPDTGTYKFTAVYYTQERDGLEVFGTRMTLLTRNVRNHPLVLADFQVRDMGDFHVSDAQRAAATPDASLASARRALGPDANILNQPRLIVWAGVEDMQVAPALAFEIIGESGDGMLGNYQAKRFVTSAATGLILHEESMVHDVDVTGNVSGMATTGVGADICGGIAQMPMPYARVAIGSTQAYADIDGNFVIPNAGATPVVVDALVRGRYFRVQNTTSPGGGNSTLSQTVTPPGPADFVFNNPNDPNPAGQYKRAEVNAYIHANKIRDLVMSANPDFPSIKNEYEGAPPATGTFLANVNISSTCNAFYSSANQTINFYVSGGASNCTNSANATVVHHEYGHRIVNAAGSGQGQYGEGFGDTMGVLVTDQPCLGQGFSPSIETTPCSTGMASCSGCLRSADNTSQYQTTGCSSCGSAIHACGRLFSGCVWSVRNYLAVTHPSTYLDILRPIVINSALLHGNVSTITPQITIHFLTLDDDDADLGNGSPHYNQINSGFTDHNMPGPDLQAFTISATPNNLTVCAPADGVATINIGQVAGQTDPVTLSLNGVPAGATASFSVNPVTPPGTSVLTIGNTGGAATGPANVLVTGNVGNIAHSTNLALHISNAAPPVPSLSTPPNGATDVPVVPTLTWNAAVQAQTYLLQVATDAGFNNIVYSATVNGTSHALPVALNTLTYYRWRVQATNGCGTSSFSSVFTFRTMAVPAILVVDDDDNGPDARSYYTAALDAIGITYDIWDTGNTAQNEPTFSQMAPYKIIIWFSGDSWAGTTSPKAGPKAATDTDIQAWLDQGGCYFLCSQDYLYDRVGYSVTTPNPFMQNYLGMASTIGHDVAQTSATGQNLFAGFGPYTLTYPFTNYSDQVPAGPNALQAFVGNQGGSVVTRDGGTYRTSFWGFPLESIPSADARRDIMALILAWCGELFPPPVPCPGDVNGDEVVNVSDLLEVINAWGPCPTPPTPCPADIAPEGGDGAVNVSDLLTVINTWGQCP